MPRYLLGNVLSSLLLIRCQILGYQKTLIKERLILVLHVMALELG